MQDASFRTQKSSADCALCSLQEDVQRRKDRALRDIDYDSHLGIERDPISREIISTASHT